MPNINQHVVPLNDQHLHIAEIWCECRPHRDAQYPQVIIHNSYDKRELYEQINATDNK